MPDILDCLYPIFLVASLHSQNLSDSTKLLQIYRNKKVILLLQRVTGIKEAFPLKTIISKKRGYREHVLTETSSGMFRL